MPFRATLERNAPTYLDELHDETALSIDTAALALAAVDVPVMVTRGSASSALFPAVVAELQTLLPTARVEVLDGGHIPHSTHPDVWAENLMSFHERHRDVATTA